MQSQLWQESASTANPTSGSQYENNGLQPQGDSFFGRGSLGQFIERSTSAPPMSTSTTLYGAGVGKDNFKQSGNALVGNVGSKRNRLHSIFIQSPSNFCFLLATKCRTCCSLLLLNTKLCL
jgi:hypothetical protein